MRYLYTVLKIVVFLLLLIFAIKNNQTIVLVIPFGPVWQQAPLILVILVFFTAGVAAGMGATFLHIFRLRRELTALKRELRSAQQAGARHPDASIDDTLG